MDDAGAKSAVLGIGRLVQQILFGGITTPLALSRGKSPFTIPQINLGENPTIQGLEDTRQNLINESMLLDKELEDLNLQLIVSQAVPDQVARGFVNTMEELEEFLGRHVDAPGVRDVARRSLERALDIREKRQTKTGLTPQEALASIHGPRNLTVYGMLSLTTTSDLLGFVQDLRTPKLGEGVTEEDILLALSRAAIPSDIAQTFIDENLDFGRTLRAGLDA